MLGTFGFAASGAAQTPSSPIATPPFQVKAQGPTGAPAVSTNSPTGLGPSTIGSVYNLHTGLASPTSTIGAGQVIAIIDAYDDVNALSDLNTFNSEYGYPTLATCSSGPPFTTTTGACFYQEDPEGTPTSTGSTASGWALEESLDLEWAHAEAPGATIVLVQALTSSSSNLLDAVSWANDNGATEVSMSWTTSEFRGETSDDSTYFDAESTSTGKPILYTASAGDAGHQSNYPAASADVIGVGGTTLNGCDDTSCSFTNETAWSDSGGGTSADETIPSYQSSYIGPVYDESAGKISTLTGGKRGIPDVSFEADPNTGVSVYDSAAYDGNTGWWTIGGTSVGAPNWAGILAAGASSGASALQGAAAIYSGGYKTYLRDITSGTNGSCGAKCTAGTGYDLVTGLGSPINYPTLAASTTSTASSITGSVGLGVNSSATDTATVTGNSTGGSPTGIVTFYSCYSASASPSSCNATSGSEVGGATLTTGSNDTSSATSASTPVTQAGYYCFFATYGGNSNYASSSDNGTNECFEVTLPLAAPTSLAATAVSASEVDLSWTGSAGATGYNVFRSTNGTSFTEVATNVTATSYPDTQYLRLPGSGASVSTPNSAALDITGNIDMRVKLSLDNWSAGLTNLVEKDAQGAYTFRISSGHLDFYFSPDGTNFYGTDSTASVPFTNGAVGWVRVTRVASSGVITYYTSSDGVSWTQLGSATTALSGSLVPGTGPLYLGSYEGAFQSLTGDLYQAEVLSGINGTVVASPNFSTASGTSFSDAEGNAWSIAGTASLSGGPALSPGTPYYYEVQAVDAGGSSGYSNVASATTPSS